jgi:hypothetical protein
MLLGALPVQLGFAKVPLQQYSPGISIVENEKKKTNESYVQYYSSNPYKIGKRVLPTNYAQRNTLKNPQNFSSCNS